MFLKITKNKIIRTCNMKMRKKTNDCLKQMWRCVEKTCNDTAWSIVESYDDLIKINDHNHNDSPFE